MHRAEVQRDADQRDAGRERVARAHDGRVDHALGLVLFVTRGQEPQCLPRGVAERVVERVFGD